jgi:hypothetical protein
MPLANMGGMLDPTAKGMSLIDFFLSQSTLRTIGIGSREDLENMKPRPLPPRYPSDHRPGFRFEEARQAFEYFAAGQHFGKVVITH